MSKTHMERNRQRIARVRAENLARQDRKRDAVSGATPLIVKRVVLVGAVDDYLWTEESGVSLWEQIIALSVPLKVPGDG